MSYLFQPPGRAHALPALETTRPRPHSLQFIGLPEAGNVWEKIFEECIVHFGNVGFPDKHTSKIVEEESLANLVLAGI